MMIEKVLLVSLLVLIFFWLFFVGSWDGEDFLRTKIQRCMVW